MFATNFAKARERRKRSSHLVKVTSPLQAWMSNNGSNREGKMALLHSFAICHRINALPLGQASGIQVPLAAFLAAIPLLAFLSTTTSTLAIPIETDWDTSADLCSSSQVEAESHQSTNAMLQTLNFVTGTGVSNDQALPCNLRVEFHGLRRLLRTLSETWGLCLPMEAALKSIYEAITQ